MQVLFVGIVTIVVCGLISLGTSKPAQTLIALLITAAIIALWAYKAVDIARRRVPSALQLQIPITGNRVSLREVEGLLHLFHDNSEQAELLGTQGVQDKILLITHRSKVYLFGPLTLVMIAAAVGLGLLSQVHHVKGGSGAFGVGVLVLLLIGVFLLQNGSFNTVAGRTMLVVLAVLGGVYVAFFLPKDQATTTGQAPSKQATYSATIGWQAYAIVVLVAVLICFAVVVKWKSFFFVVTNLEAIIIHQYPVALFFIPPRQLSMLLIHTGTIGNTRPFLGTIFNYGAVDMDSGEERDKPFNDIRGMSGPDHVVSIVKDAAKQARGLYGGI